jgi:DNA-binding MarR family transcriptional regulator
MEVKMKFNDMPSFKLVKIIHLKRLYVDSQLSKLALTRTQWQIMIILDILEEPISQQDILKNIDIDAAQLTRTLNQLENNNYIARYREQQNRRSAFIKITVKGKKIIQKIKTVMENETRIFFTDFSEDEKKSFLSQLKKVEKNFISGVENQSLNERRK